MTSFIGLLFIVSIVLIVREFRNKEDQPPKIEERFLQSDHPQPYDLQSTVKWAKEILEDKDRYLILDTETTGLGKNDVVIQIGIIDLNGNVLLDTLIKPTRRKRMSKEATAIHGITMKDLEGQPTLRSLLPRIEQIYKGKFFLVYNEAFDQRLIEQTLSQDDANKYSLSSKFSRCIMEQYSKFKGAWSDYHHSYTFQKLKGGDHTAVGDCRAALAVLHEMADY